MELTKDQVRQIGRLSGLKLTEDELVAFAQQLSHVLAYVEKLKELDTAGVAPTSHAVELTNVWRGDERRECLAREVALRAAPQHTEEFVVVPRIVEG